MILLDLEMPGLNGHDTLAALKADDDLRDLPVIIISSVDELASVVRCIEAGAADYLPKTVDPAILRARIGSSLAQKRLRDNERSLIATIDLQRSQLARFLSPQVAALVSSPDGEAMLAGHRREITVMFCDLRNFTVFSESAEPEEVLGFLREYHAEMGALIVAYEGTLEHFAGDGFMTFFNDPVLQPDHAARAIGLAVAMRETFVRVSQEWRRRGHLLEIGIGIATGYATMGRIGFEGRYDYGAIGNAIILAARLSSEAGPGEILVTQRTYGQAEGSVVAEPAGERLLKGFSRPVGTYAVQAMADDGRARRRRGGRRGRGGGHVTLDPAILEQLLDMTGGDVEFVDSLVDTYLVDSPSLLERLRAAAADGDAAAAVLPAHTLASTSLTLGATTFGQLCRALEADARTGVVPDMEPRVAAIDSGFDAVRAALLQLRADRLGQTG